MKIGVVTEYYYPSLGGITEHVHHFCLELKKLGHHPVIITGNAGECPSDCGLDVIRVGKSVPLYSNGSIARVTVGYRLGHKVKEIMRSEKFDIVHVHSPFIPTLPALGQKYSGTVTFGTFHTQFDSSLFMQFLKSYAKKFFDGLAARIAVSDLCIESIGRYYKGDFKIIPNGIDINKFYPACKKMPEFLDGRPNILFLSRLEPRNGLDYLIEAFCIIKNNGSNCRLIVAGDGPLRAYYESIVPNELKKDVIFLGHVTENRPNIYATVDIFCFPTTRASFGITLLEAMSSGKPVVAFSMPAYQKIIESGKDGILCGDIKSANLAAGIQELLNDIEKRKSIGAHARKKAEEYSWANVTRRVLDLYEQAGA